MKEPIRNFIIVNHVNYESSSLDHLKLIKCLFYIAQTLSYYYSYKINTKAEFLCLILFSFPNPFRIIL